MKTITAQEIQTWKSLEDPADPGEGAEKSAFERAN